MLGATAVRVYPRDAWPLSTSPSGRFAVGPPSHVAIGKAAAGSGRRAEERVERRRARHVDFVHFVTRS
jgi:hypothetical protein